MPRFPTVNKELFLDNSKGFGLIEVLVTLLLVTLGILGMVALQARGLQMTQDAVQRNSAIELTSQITDIIRSHPEALYVGSDPLRKPAANFNNSSLFLKSEGGNFSPAPATLSGTDCLAPDTAQRKRDCWLEDVKTRLPNAEALIVSDFYICRSSLPGTCDNKSSTLEFQLAWAVKKGTCPVADLENESICIYRSRIEL